MTLTKCLAETLVEQLQGNEGWDFALPPAGKKWNHFIATPRDDWAMIINYLLEVTFGKPLKTFRSVLRRPDRGRDFPLYLQTAPANGIAMSLYHYSAGDFDGWEPLDWLAEEDAPEWTSVSNSPTSELGQGGGGDGSGPTSEDPGDHEPGNGPISAIVFEVGDRRDPKADSDKGVAWKPNND